MKKYQVIGGQYEQYWYGESDTICGAKNIATRNEELWDNWQGWHKPHIYKREDCEKIVCKGLFTHVDGEETIMHKWYAEPVVYGGRVAR